MSRQGIFYEEKAKEFLKRKGYRILKQNFSWRSGEIDLIARDKGVTAFIEVKSRNQRAGYAPSEAVTRAKRKKIIRTAKVYCRRKGEGNYRFDVVSITQGDSWLVYELIQNAFGADEVL